MKNIRYYYKKIKVPKEGCKRVIPRRYFVLVELIIALALFCLLVFPLTHFFSKAETLNAKQLEKRWLAIEARRCFVELSEKCYENSFEQAGELHTYDKILNKPLPPLVVVFDGERRRQYSCSYSLKPIHPFRINPMGYRMLIVEVTIEFTRGSFKADYHFPLFVVQKNR